MNVPWLLKVPFFTQSSFPSFAKLCVYRQILDAVSRDGNEKNKPLSNYVELNVVEDLPDSANPLESLLRKEYAAKLNMVIEQHLSPMEQKVIRLFAEGYSYEDISEMLGKTFKAVDGALQRARKKLQNYM